MPLGSKTKGAIILLCTLLVGIALGSLGMGALTRQRLQVIPNPHFFTRHTLRLIQPRFAVRLVAQRDGPTSQGGSMIRIELVSLCASVLTIRLK